ncbi:MAG: tRNA preQ1(34) S-adenosylmethionine ribosyltransferase-isomerase QueA [Thermomicrobiales bacterium]|nr:tRNA preQ1(34) S-adenosylmethionine ribosyltransferase-isomerase QueA [Thermomicrobiales bacterium]
MDPALRTADFSYDLPPELIAQEPIANRHQSRLMVVDRRTGDFLHTTFEHIGEFLQPGDVVVANNSKVIAARLHFRREPDGGRGEILLLRKQEDGLWEALARPAKRLRRGEELTVLPHGEDAQAIPGGIILEDRGSEGIVNVNLAKAVEANLESLGDMPLPPYISHRLDDRDRYQTTYASAPGSAAAPTAGLHFSPELISGLKQQGIRWAEVTLHIGLDTFRPVSADRVADHQIHTEWCTVPAAAARLIDEARADGKRVIALGTTAARTLETAGQIWGNGEIRPFSADTSIFITPGFEWTVVDALITNFHLPRSTLLMMVSAFAGRELILKAYSEAIAQHFRFYSFGDGMLIV